MSSPKLSERFGPDAADRLIRAVADVAERSFFSAAEPCDGRRFAEIAAAAQGWLVARVRFAEPECSGAVSCRLPQALARALFDAFNGRDPDDPDPPSDQLFDLVGEFSNMVCGTWLTRTASRRSFTLARPEVAVAAAPAPRGGAALTLLAVNDLPLAVEIGITGLT